MNRPKQDCHNDAVIFKATFVNDYPDGIGHPMWPQHFTLENAELGESPPQWKALLERSPTLEFYDEYVLLGPGSAFILLHQFQLPRDLPGLNGRWFVFRFRTVIDPGLEFKVINVGLDGRSFKISPTKFKRLERSDRTQSETDAIDALFTFTHLQTMAISNVEVVSEEGKFQFELMFGERRAKILCRIVVDLDDSSRYLLELDASVIG